MHVGMDILLIALDDVFTSTLQSKSINFGSETTKRSGKGCLPQIPSKCQVNFVSINSVVAESKLDCKTVGFFFLKLLCAKRECACEIFLSINSPYVFTLPLDLLFDKRLHS